MARGSGPDNATTSWSCNALQKYTAISRSRAKIAKTSLISHGLVKQTKTGNLPRYKLLKEKGDELVWLPNEFVNGTGIETPPLERLRQTADVQIIRLLIDLYAEANMADDGGVPHDVFFGKYERERIAESHEFTIWGFDEGNLHCYPNHKTVSPHYNGDDSSKFFERLECLGSIGLLQYQPVLFDALGGEIIHELTDPFTQEADLAFESRFCVERLLPDDYEYRLEGYQYVAPVKTHIKEVCLMGIAYMRYRQNTQLTAAGFAKAQNRIRQYREAYSQIAVQIPHPAISREHQGIIKG
jgi:hypothetical protein